MLEFTLAPAKFNIGCVRQLVADIGEDQMCLQPQGIVNHPAWQLGHLAWASDVGMRLLGKTLSLPGNWESLFALGSQPVGDAGSYPHKEVLWHAFADGQTRLVEAVQSAKLDELRSPTPIPMMAEFFPTLGDLMMHLMTSHIGSHVGQLRLWRGAMGFPHVGW